MAMNDTLQINYSVCGNCGTSFVPGSVLTVQVVSATPGGDSLLRFVHQQCPSIAPTASTKPSGSRGR